ncbi:hypothetical protein LZ31DRAFT_42768 [Colletotrichum somersetense]|nr:hypothetical protein LZ31DRAFT_42768 [Colletotrichum somersetense]
MIVYLATSRGTNRLANCTLVSDTQNLAALDRATVSLALQLQSGSAPFPAPRRRCSSVPIRNAGLRSLTRLVSSETPNSSTIPKVEDELVTAVTALHPTTPLSTGKRALRFRLRTSRYSHTVQAGCSTLVTRLRPTALLLTMKRGRASSSHFSTSRDNRTSQTG